MNYLFIAQSDLIDKAPSSLKGPLLANLSDERAKEAIKDHGLKSGIKISCVVEGVGRGRVVIGSCTCERVELSAEIEQALPARMSIDLVVAYSRPQTIKKLLQLASALGLRSLSFVKTENVVASYLQSKSLELAAIRRQLLLGCEQAGDGLFPELSFFKNFHEFIKSELLTKKSDNRFFGDVGAKVSVCEFHNDALLFLGPESGFTLKEKRDLESYGFKPLSLGPRMHRVEIAAAMLLGKLEA